METINGLTGGLNKVTIQLPANVKQLIRNGALTVYDLLELAINTLSEIVTDSNNNAEALENWTKDVSSWSKNFKDSVAKMIQDGILDSNFTIEEGSIGENLLSSSVQSRLVKGIYLESKTTDGEKSWSLNIVSSAEDTDGNYISKEVKLDSLVDYILSKQSSVAGDGISKVTVDNGGKINIYPKGENSTPHVGFIPFAKDTIKGTDEDAYYGGLMTIEQSDKIDKLSSLAFMKDEDLKEKIDNVVADKKFITSAAVQTINNKPCLVFYNGTTKISTVDISNINTSVVAPAKPTNIAINGNIVSATASVTSGSITKYSITKENGEYEEHEYTGNIVLDETCTVTIWAEKDGVRSEGTTIEYEKVTDNNIPAPEISQESNYIVITYSPDYVAYFTIDGTEPEPKSGTSKPYSKKYPCTKNAVVKAICYDVKTGLKSDTTTFNFVFQSSSSQQLNSPFTVATWNIHGGAVKQGKVPGNLKNVLIEAGNPDIVGVQEYVANPDYDFGYDQYNMQQAVFSDYTHAHIEDPNSTSSGGAKNAIFANKTSSFTPNANVFTASNGVTAISSVVKIGNVDTLVVSYHAHFGGTAAKLSSSSKSAYSIRQRHAKELRDYIAARGFGGANDHVIILADFNSSSNIVADSYISPHKYTRSETVLSGDTHVAETNEFVGKYVDENGEAMTPMEGAYGQGWIDAGYEVAIWRIATSGFRTTMFVTDINKDGVINTSDQFWPIDNIVVKGFTISNVCAADVFEKYSDHKMIYATLTLK